MVNIDLPQKNIEKPGASQNLDSYFEFSEVKSKNKKNLELKFNNLVNQLENFDSNPEKAMEQVFQLLKNNGFKYDENYFTAQDVLKKRKGNCSGLTALVGSILEQKGLKPKYEIVVNPKDAVFAAEQKLFNEFYKGNIESLKDYNNSKLPIKQEIYPDFRFVPQEHPIIILEDKKFDFTDLDAEYLEQANYDSEQQTSVNFDQLTSTILVDKIRQKFYNIDYQDAKNKILKALEIWPDNREAYVTLRDLALNSFDDKLLEFAEKKYKSYADKANDSLYFHHLYEITKKQEDLDKALKLCPSNIPVFVEKNKLLSNSRDEFDKKDAKFNFAVAAHCIAQSGVLKLDDFYINNAKILNDLYGKDKILKILKNVKKQELIYYTALYDVDKDIKHLQTIIDEKLLFKELPYFRTYFLSKIQNILKNRELHIPEQDREKYDLNYGLSEEQRNSRIFQDLIKD